MMVVIMLLSLITTLTWFNLLTDNPIALSISIMTIALISTFMYVFILSSWFAMVLFFIFIGGMMIMFSYFISLSCNELSSSSKKILLSTPMLLLLNSSYYVEYKGPSVANFYNMNSMMILIIGFVLLLMLLIVMNVLFSNKAPMRKFVN